MNMRKAARQAIGAVMAFGTLAAAHLALAQSAGSGQGSSNGTITLANPIAGASFDSVLANVTNFLLVDIAIPLTVIMVLVGAFQMITAGGNEDKFSQGRKTLLYAAIGFAVALISNGIVDLIRNIITGS